MITYERSKNLLWNNYYILNQQSTTSPMTPLNLVRDKLFDMKNIQSLNVVYHDIKYLTVRGKDSYHQDGDQEHS